MGESFTWFPKLTRTVERVPEEQRGLLLWALVQYGTNGTEPELEYPLDMAFEALRDDIDNSKNNRHRNRGGRPKKTTVTQEETPVCESETPVTEVSETENPGYADAEPKPNQTNTDQSNTNQKKRVRFTPPTVEEVRSYCAEKGFTFDPEAFVAFYESKGWKVGRNPMKSWKAACTTWQKRQGTPKGGGGDEYSNL